MNGEVMDETIETPQQSKNETLGQEHLLHNQISEKKDEKICDPKEEETAGDGSVHTCEGDKKDLQVKETTSTGTSISEEATNITEQVCDGSVESKNIQPPGKTLDGVNLEGLRREPITSNNGLDKNENDNKNINIKISQEPESELENSNSFPEKINNNSKDSSMLSTTDTQDEIETTDNGDHIFINHIHNQKKKASKNDIAKKQMLDLEIESEDSLEEMLGSDLDLQTEETFSIVSGSEYDEASQGSVLDKSTDVIVVENAEPPSQNGNKSPEVHEIQSDNEDDDECVVTALNKTIENKKKATNNTELRRSSRTIKRKKYSYDYENIDEESDIEEIPSGDPLKRKSRPIMINDTKSLVEIAAKQAARSTSAQRKEPQLVLIGSNLTAKNLTPNKSTGSNMNASLYQSIVARGTTVTPVPNKQPATTSTQTMHAFLPAPPLAPAILPSLTDDMFVVEAPSFIVPYVYEKPSIEPFKEFVTNLGKELEEQRLKAEKELLEKKKEEKAKRLKERQEKKDRGEEVEGSEEESQTEIDEARKRKLEKKEQRRRRKEEDDDSWDGSDSSDSDDLSDEDGASILINDKDDCIEEVKDDLEIAPVAASKSENYFECSLGKFFMSIGMGLVEEYVQTDLIKQQKRRLQREKKSGQNTKASELSISLLMKNLELSKENNEPYTCSQLKCEHCSFKTESALVLAQHLETPHMKNNMYKCNFCSFEIRSPHDILYHMEAEHNVRGKLERAPAYHQCANCPFEDNGKGKLARHLVACAKKFKPEQNLSPPLEWEPPAKIPKVAKPRNTMLGSPYTGTASTFSRQQFGSSFGRPIVTGVIPGVGGYRPRSRFPPPAPRPVQAGGSIVRGSSMLRQNATALYNLGNTKKSVHQPSISITPLPRQPVPVHVQAGQNAKGTFVICEICDGYIKDLDQLRNHMQWIHKVKIHPKMIYNRPPLNCQKCQFRFFTDQGLERHLLGSHGLVTSSMQEAANKSKDAGRCPVCGKVYQWKLLNHVARDHNLTLKPAHLSYKCTVCTATFGMYKLFENHVYSAHSVVAKRVMDKNVPAKTKANTPKGLKINDEITITAQPTKAPAVTNKDK